MAAPRREGPRFIGSRPVRPQTGYYADLIEEAAALWESLAQNHSFVDGNKRTAFAARILFLLSTAIPQADTEETYLFIADLYKVNQFRFDNSFPGCAHTWKRGLTPTSDGKRSMLRHYKECQKLV